MSRRRKKPRGRPVPRQRRVEPPIIRAVEAEPELVAEFLRYGGPPVFPCGCSAEDAVQIGIEDAGTDPYPMGDELSRGDIEEFGEMSAEPPVIWWHDCPERENIVLRSRLESFPD